MGLSDKTVKNYLANAMEKLNLTRRSQAAALFVTQNRRFGAGPRD
jgi:DNA-binding CsgD family transcriptional regulator